MRFMKITVLVSTLLIGFAVFEQKADAYTSFSFGFSNYHHGYGYYPYRYYRPFYNPYFYQPYSYGFGYGYGYPYYSGYYPGSYYRGYGEIRAEVKPSQAKVFVDGDYVGIADDYDGWWQRLDLVPGKHRIVFRTPGYVPYAVTMRIMPGQDYHVKYQMTPGQDVIDESQMRLPKEEYERHDSRRHYEDRYRDQPRYEPRGEDPYRYEPRNEDQYRYEPRREDREYGKEQSRDDVNLIVQIQPDDATVYIDGNYYGTAETGGTGEIQVMLPAGTHRIEVVRPGFESYSQNVTVEERSTKRIDVRLRKKGE